MSQIHEKLKMSHMNQTLTLVSMYFLGPAGGFVYPSGWQYERGKLRCKNEAESYAIDHVIQSINLY